MAFKPFTKGSTKTKDAPAPKGKPAASKPCPKKKGC